MLLNGARPEKLSNLPAQVLRNGTASVISLPPRPSRKCVHRFFSEKRLNRCFFFFNFPLLKIVRGVFGCVWDLVTFNSEKFCDVFLCEMYQYVSCFPLMENFGMPLFIHNMTKKHINLNFSDAKGWWFKRNFDKKSGFSREMLALQTFALIPQGRCLKK